MRLRFLRFPTLPRLSIRNSIQSDHRLRLSNAHRGFERMKERKWGCRKTSLEGKAENAKRERKRELRRRLHFRRSCRFLASASLAPSPLISRPPPALSRLDPLFQKIDLGPGRHPGKPHRRPHFPLRARSRDPPDLGGLQKVVLRRRRRREGEEGRRRQRRYSFCFFQGSSRDRALLLQGSFFFCRPPQADPLAGLGTPFALPRRRLARGDPEPRSERPPLWRRRRQEPSKQPRGVRQSPRLRRHRRRLGLPPSPPLACFLRGGLFPVRRRRCAERQRRRLLGGGQLRLRRL